MKEIGAHRAKEFNVGLMNNDTGVRYADVAGIDSIKTLIAETMSMMMGDKRYEAIGARAPRVCFEYMGLARLHSCCPGLLL